MLFFYADVISAVVGHYRGVVRQATRHIKSFLHMQVSVRHIVTQMPDSLAIDRAQPSDSAGVLEEVNDDDDMVRVFAKVHILRAYVRYCARYTS